MKDLFPVIHTCETGLRDPEKILVISPEGEAGKAAAARLMRAAAEHNANVEVMENPVPGAMYSHSGPAILIGNLADSRCVKELYYKFLCTTDLWYPGPGGYELRTLINPFNTGGNIIHLGYSDTNGLSEGAAVLEQRMETGVITYLREVKASRLHFPEGKAAQIRQDKIDLDDPTIYLTAGIDEKGYLAYLTGDNGLLEEYCMGWEALLKLEVVHLMLHKRAVVWRLLEITGMIPQNLRQRLVNFFYVWANGEEGVGSIENIIYQSPHFPRQNHGLIPAMGLVYLSDYFGRFYPELEAPRLWREKADSVYAPYFDGSWKPICDGLCHGWWLSQPAMLDYGLMDDKHRYFENGGALMAAECAIAIVNNEGWMPNSGDSDILRQFPGFSLSIAAAYYKDGRYSFVNEMAPFSQRGYSGPITYPPRAFDIGIAEEIPHDKTGITVVPMDPLIYNVWSREPGISAAAADTPPETEIDKCFDKLAMRTGWGKDDEYLLLDGLGGGSHSYADAMSILDYQKHGVSFIVAEDSLHWPEPENHSMVTVYRDGRKQSLPAFAQLLEAYICDNGSMYASMKLKGYNASEWVREVLMIPDKCVAFHDTITVCGDGCYAIEAHFRTPGHARLDGNTMKSTRKTRNGEEIQFTLTGVCSEQASYSLDTIPIDINYRTLPGKTPPVSPETDSAAAVRRRYHFDDTEDICLSSYTARSAVRLTKGETVSFTHIAYVSGSFEDVKIQEDRGRVEAILGEEVIPLPFKWSGIAKEGAGICNSAPIETKAIEVAQYPAGIKAAELVHGKYILCGTADGILTLAETSGKKIWSASLGNTVHTLCWTEDKGGMVFFAGYGWSGLAAFDGKGNRLWDRELKRIPTLYPWWEYDHPTPVEVTAGISDGEAYVIAGCGDNYVRKLARDGSLENAYYYFASIPGYIRIVDVDDDGEQEVIVAGGIMSADSGIEILDKGSRCIARFASEGWVSRTTAVEYARMKDYNVIACGINHRKNLQLYRIERSPSRTDMDGENRSISLTRLVCSELAGAVTGIALIPFHESVFAGTSQGFVKAFDFKGKELWMKLLDGAVTYMTAFKDRIIVADSNGKVYVMSVDGTCESVCNTGSIAVTILKDTENLYFAAGKQIYRIDQL